MSAPMLNKLDELLNQLRTGWWSVLHYITMGFCMALPVSHALSGPFVAPRVEFTCLQPPNEVSGPFINDDLESGNGTELSQRYFNNSERYCSQYNQIMDGGIYEEGNCTELHFDKSVFTKTITSEFELICDRNYLRATYQSIYMGGVFFGCLLSAILADKYGRKGVIIFGVITFTALGLASSWTRNLSALLFCRFLMGVIMPFMSNNCYIMVNITGKLGTHMLLDIYRPRKYNPSNTPVGYKTCSS
ncbi:organic cation transporter-like protein [Palaemon carinicauda]|uniref:organic cation transporter-like protein n=1 Tax=Palaemon carinicauda TaxID=392227 RepID=UPI0035B6292C